MEKEAPADYLARIDESIKGAMASYLRVCSSGGMPKKLREDIQSAINDAARLGYFSLGLAPIIAPGLQDTRRLDALDAHRELVVENQTYSSPEGEHVGNAWSLSGPHADVRAAIDAIMPETTSCSTFNPT